MIGSLLWAQAGALTLGKKPKRSMSEGQKPYSLTLLFGICVTLVLLGPLFWLHMEMPENKPPLRAVENGDMWERVVPATAYLHETMQQGILPLWNPYQFCGAPFLNDPRHGFFQPLSWVFPLLPPSQALALHAFIAMMLMGLFFLLYAGNNCPPAPRSPSAAHPLPG